MPYRGSNPGNEKTIPRTVASLVLTAASAVGPVDAGTVQAGCPATATAPMKLPRVLRQSRGPPSLDVTAVA